jgi:hypothetical protein
MPQKSKDKINVYLEIGTRRTFAAAMDWPGWCRVGKDEASALQALFDYGLRYATVLRPARLGFHIPKDISEFNIVERLKGNTTTDFGAPDVAPKSDAKALDDLELRRLQKILKACWRAFDSAIEQATDKTLSTGPRGGGRPLDGIVEHVLGSEKGYLSQLGGKTPDPGSAVVTREAVLETLKASAHGEIAGYGPRGGRRWSPQYFIRREAWHVLDHVWEIEDRLKKSTE